MGYCVSERGLLFLFLWCDDPDIFVPKGVGVVGYINEVLKNEGELIAKIHRLIIAYKQQSKVMEEHNKLMDKVEIVMAEQTRLKEVLVNIMDKNYPTMLEQKQQKYCLVDTWVLMMLFIAL